ncbi:uracil-DNA glycosylase [Candidatus Woesearchaeota archaeon]|nr:MAG: uracil-DNA glycosylase [Candidatus Woesearchaeota archaeon]
MILESINKRIRNCKRCQLYTQGRAVPGEGPDDAEIMLVGQAPGKIESIRGKPFIGKAGRFLDELLEIADLKREKVFITSVLKHYPPKNRPPRKDEILACKPFLEQQIEIIKPKVIVLMGNVAIKSILDNQSLKVTEMHGKKREKSGRRYLLTFHPAAGMRFPKIKKLIKSDFKKLKNIKNKV